MAAVAVIQTAPRAQLGRQAAWFAGGLALAFTVPAVGTDVLDLHHDVYYAAYFAAVLAFLTLYVRSTHLDVVALVQRSWRLSVAVGLIVAVAVVANVLQDPETARPAGAYFGFEILWRGVAYGTVDALLLQAFPGAVALTVLGGTLDGLRRRVGFAALALALVMALTAVYHLGYEQFRDDGVRQPETGNAILSLPMLVSANPLGSIVAHASMHVAAATHAYETPTYLPPQVRA